MMANPFSWEKSGGLARRYKDYPRGVRRLVDPITNRLIAFGDDLAFENWLLHRFDPQVNELEHSPVPIEVIGPAGAPLRAVAHLSLTRKDGGRELHLVFKSMAPEGHRRVLASIAKVLGGKLVLRSRPEIREDVVCTANLRYLRQVMTMWRGAGSEIDAAVRGQLACTGSMVREQLTRAHPQYDPGLIDSRLGYMHCQGELSILFTGVSYGDRTVITTAQ